MPKVLIISDSHGLSDEVQKIKDRHSDEVDGMIHCGDSELPFDDNAMDQFQKVQGNCDMDERYQEELDFTIGDLTFFVTHGHLFRVKSTLMPLSYRADELGAQVICFGHSHTAGVEMVDGKLFINPGSIRLPRGITEKTYATLYWEDPSVVTVEFFTDQGVVIPDLTYTADFQTEE
ncbi:metallophosphoesterase [Pontibacillus yanchengensis]|uniref:Phosphoesterase n=1 Tax=Pontibacillus yanchengensis Y32 TaxID=1385514 RepID=A0A0A2TX96_9BACI|nr:metallophosphoesterase [Pontibacillus yanchengensis]KGP73860.1 metallophosphatase [Pontibacillus yanchengensis Y32]